MKSSRAALIQRYSDVILALRNSYDYDVPLGKLQLQKYIYLSDILSLLWNILSNKDGHETYKHGPYDFKIQNAVDALAFRGFVQIDYLNFSPDNENTIAKYRINDLGLQLSEKLLVKDLYHSKNRIYHFIANQIEIRGWNDLKGIVYSELSYVNKVGYYQNIDTNSYFSNQTIQLVDLFNNLKRDRSNSFTPENLVEIFFSLTDRYRKNINANYA